MTLKVKRVALGDLTLDPDNVRLHGERNIEAIKASLTRFGQVEPLIVQASTKVVIGGNGRLEAMRGLGWTEADVCFVDLDAAKARALGITLNRTAELAEWDKVNLDDFLKSIKDDFPIESLGFSQADLDQISLDPPAPGVGAKELNEGDFQSFDKACPRCGFEFDNASPA